MDVGSSGRRASLPERLPAEVTARQPVDPEAVSVPRVREPEPVAEHLRHIHDRKQVVSYGLEDGRPHSFLEGKARRRYLHVPAGGIRCEEKRRHGVSPPQIFVWAEAVAKMLE